MNSQCPSIRRRLWIFLSLLSIAFLCMSNSCAIANDRPNTDGGAPLIFVFGFPTPPDVSVTADLGYKLKSGQWMEPDVTDFADLGSELKRAIAGKLADKLGHGTVALPNLGSEGADRYVADDGEYQKQAQEAGAKFCL